MAVQAGGDVYQNVINTGHSMVHMGKVINNLNVQFMQQGPWLPATASISAYESVIILTSYYQSFCLKLEPFVTGDDNAPEVASVLLRESVAFGETLAQVLQALDATQNPNAYVRPGEIVVSLTDALLLMCQIQTSVAPLIDSVATQNEQSTAHWDSKAALISDIARALKKQGAAFAFQLTMLNCKTDAEASAICDALSNLLEERFVNNQALLDRVLPLQAADETTLSSAAETSDVDNLSQSGQSSATSELNDQIEHELYKSKAYGGKHEQAAYGSSILDRGSLRTTTTVDTFYSVLSAIRVPVAEAELEACRSEVEGDPVQREDTPPPVDDWGLLGAILRGEGPPLPGSIEDSTKPIWDAHLNSDSSTESPWARKVILTLDSGGVRSYASVRILQALMEKVKQIEREEPDPLLSASSVSYSWSGPECYQDGSLLSRYSERGIFRPCDYIDYFAGTSTGGVLAMMLGCLRMSMPQVHGAFSDLCTNIFANPRRGTFRLPLTPRYRTRDVEYAFQALSFANEAGPKSLFSLTGLEREYVRRLAGQVCLHDHGRTLGPRTMVTAWGGSDEQNRKQTVFRSYSYATSVAMVGSAEYSIQALSLPLWKIARATTAAPTYFAPMLIGASQYIDGAVGGLANPSDLAYREVKALHPEQEPFIIISIGTGKRDRNHSGPAQRSSVPIIGEGIQAIKDVQRTLVDADRSHETLSHIIESTNNARPAEDHVHYYRFDVPSDLPSSARGMGSIRLDEWPGNGGAVKEKIERAVGAYLDTCGESWTQCARKLVEMRRRRQRTARWESFALDLRYVCPTHGACASQGPFTRFQLYRHAMEEHQIFTLDLFTWTWTCRLTSCTVGQPSFERVDEYRRHMRQEHGITMMRTISNEEMERWLDRGRHSGRGTDDKVHPWLATE